MAKGSGEAVEEGKTARLLYKLAPGGRGSSQLWLEPVGAVAPVLRLDSAEPVPRPVSVEVATQGLIAKQQQQPKGGDQPESGEQRGLQTVRERGHPESHHRGGQTM